MGSCRGHGELKAKINRARSVQPMSPRFGGIPATPRRIHPVLPHRRPRRIHPPQRRPRRRPHRPRRRRLRSPPPPPHRIPPRHPRHPATTIPVHHRNHHHHQQRHHHRPPQPPHLLTDPAASRPPRHHHPLVEQPHPPLRIQLTMTRPTRSQDRGRIHCAKIGVSHDRPCGAALPG